MIHDFVEDYVDDLVVKSKRATDHVVHLQKVFGRYRKYKLKMNPKKCTFGVNTGKFLGVIVHREGITVDEAKAAAIREMPSPKNQDQLRTLIGKVSYLRRFIPGLAELTSPMTKLLKKDVPGETHEVAIIEEEQKWQLMFDGAAVARKGGIGIVLIGPESQVITKACKMMYGCSNNEAEYEALITGLELAASKGIKHLAIKGDSRLVIQQLKGEFAVKEPALTKYRAKAQQILQNFQAFHFEHVSRSQNRYADALATLASRIDD
ncbi:hypothetical protein UlMin_025079 [Ulmus minor]